MDSELLTSGQIVCNRCADAGDFTPGKPIVWFKEWDQLYCPEHYQESRAIYERRLQEIVQDIDERLFGRKRKKAKSK